MKRAPRRGRCGRENCDNGGARCSSSSRYSCKQQFYAQSFSNVEVHINSRKIYNSIGLYCVFNNFKGASLNTREFCIVRGTTMKKKEFPVGTTETLLCEPFSQEWKWWTHLMASCCMVSWELIFSPLLNGSIKIWKICSD